MSFFIVYASLASYMITDPHLSFVLCLGKTVFPNYDIACVSLLKFMQISVGKSKDIMVEF